MSERIKGRRRRREGGRKRLINRKGIEGLRVQTRIHLGGKNEGDREMEEEEEKK